LSNLTSGTTARLGRRDQGGGIVQSIRGSLEHASMHASVSRPPPAKRDDADADIPLEQRKTIAELENHHCRWPIGTVGKADFFYCGHPSADMAARIPYCQHHLERAWVKRTSRPFQLYKLPGK
jgi:GcrA cell cycle regulator